MDKFEGHTPGPLETKGPAKYIPNFSDGGDYGIIAPGDRQVRIIGEAIHKVGKGDYVNAEANARLWAAAPTILAERDALAARVEALETAAKETVEFIEDNDHPRSCPASYGGDNPCRCGRNQVYDLLLVALGPEENNDERTEV